jgi:hypothetical protein
MMNGVAGMAVTISAKDTRSIRAIEIAAGTATWLHIREVGNGRVIGYQIPSQSKADGYYVVTQTFCTCFDAKRNQAKPASTSSRSGCMSNWRRRASRRNPQRSQPPRRLPLADRS